MSKLYIASSLLFLASHVSAAFEPSSLSSLLKRQDPSIPGEGDIPAACTTTCAPIETTVNSCQDLSCLCSDSVAQQIATCLNCLIAVEGSSLGSQGQSILDQFTNACDTSGEPVSSLKVSSVAPSGSASGGTSVSITAALPSGSGSPSQSIGFGTTPGSGGTSSAGVIPPSVSASNSGSLNPTQSPTGNGAVRVGITASVTLAGVAAVFMAIL